MIKHLHKHSHNHDDDQHEHDHKEDNKKEPCGHDHDHEDEHNHVHEETNSQNESSDPHAGHNHGKLPKVEAGSDASKNLMFAIALNLVIVVFEIIFGVLSRSMALISDALHNFTDIGSMVLSLWGEKVSKKPATTRKTFGYKRMEVIIAFINAGALLGISGWVMIESIMRLFDPQPVVGKTMFIVALVSLIGNGIATYILEKNSHDNLNLKSAWLHSLQDALFSLAVVIGAAVIYYTGWNWIDPIASIAISLFLLKEVFEIMSQAVNMLLDSVPEDLDFEEVKKSLADFKEIESVHDLHIWQTGTDNRYVSAHLKIKQMSGNERAGLLAKLMTLLKEKYRINHPTLQMISQEEMDEVNLICDHCN